MTSVRTWYQEISIREGPEMSTDTMTKPAAKLVVAKKSEAHYVKGRREFFKYRDLGVTDGTNGRMRAQHTSAIAGMTEPTGWHYHLCETQFVYILNGWIDLAFEDGGTIRFEAGDSAMIPGGLRHNELRTSDDFEILEISVPAEMGTVAYEPPATR